MVNIFFGLIKKEVIQTVSSQSNNIKSKINLRKFSDLLPGGANKSVNHEGTKHFQLEHAKMPQQGPSIVITIIICFGFYTYKEKKRIQTIKKVKSSVRAAATPLKRGESANLELFR